MLTCRSPRPLCSTPFQLDGYTAEWDDLCRAQNAHAVEVDVLRTANRQLSSQVKQLESSLATLNTEHCQVVKDLVLAKVAREEMEAELVKYKMLCAPSVGLSVPDVELTRRPVPWQVCRAISSVGRV